MDVIDESILRRLILAKTFLISAKGAINRAYDENALAVATVMLHDAVDNLLGAVVSRKSLRLKPSKSFMKDMYDAIVAQGTALTRSTEISQLNTHRNNIKHQGLVPNTRDITTLLPKITDFCEVTCLAVFNIPLSKISRKNQIEDPKSRADIESIEKSVVAKNYKKALFDTASALFVHFTDQYLAMWRVTSMTLPVISGKKISAYEMAFPNGVARELNLDLMEIGIDPYLYYRFRNLTPDVGYVDYKDKRFIYKMDGHTWHEDNWTEENALFCLNFLIDALISQQRKYSGYTIVSRDVTHKIKFLRDSQSLNYMKQPARSYKSGAELGGKLIDYADGKVQPSKESEIGYTHIMIDAGEKHEIILLKIGDFEVIGEQVVKTDQWF